MKATGKLDYLEMPATGATLDRAKAFYSRAFGWAFTSYGDEYVDTADSGLVLGVNGIADERQQAAPLAVLYVSDLAAARDLISRHGAWSRWRCRFPPRRVCLPAGASGCGPCR